MSTPSAPTRWCAEPRDAVEVAGPDALSYLHSQLSQRVDDLAVGASRWTLVLQPAGKIDALARVWRVDEERFVVDTDAGFGDVLAARLARFKIRVRAELMRRSLTSITAWGGSPEPGSDAVVGWWAVGVHLLGEAPVAPVGWAEANAGELLAARVDAGWPAMGAEIVVGESIPAESGIVSVAVDFTKGCYPGQELVERMDSRGSAAPRLLRRLTVAEGARPGDPIVVDGADVGLLTSVAGTRALGLVRRTVELGDPVTPPAAAPPPPA